MSQSIFYSRFSNTKLCRSHLLFIDTVQHPQDHFCCFVHRFSPSQGFVSVVRVSTKGSIGDSLEEVKDIIVDFRNFPKIVENTLV